MNKTDCLHFSIKNKTPLSITTAKGSTFQISPYDIQNSKLYYNFSNGKPGQIMLLNIFDMTFTNQKDEELYHEWEAGQYFSVENPKVQVTHMYRYYEELLQKLKTKSDKPEIIDFKMKIFEEIFQKKNLCSDKKNLLLQYLLGSQEHLEEGALPKDLILLLQQSNPSQKRCIEAALENRVSVIEGPPGTGKTTTILSVIANMVWQKQKVLVVSKNNSAIDNVAEELSEMDLPQFFIRMGNDEVMRKSGTGLREKLMRYEADLIGLSDDIPENGIIPSNESKSELEITGLYKEKETETEQSALNEGISKESVSKESISKEIEDAEQKIHQVYSELIALEHELNELVQAENECKELKNQLRHLEKRRNSYEFSIDDMRSGARPRQASAAKHRVEFLNELSVQLNQEERIGFIQRLRLLIFCGETLNRFQRDGIYQILALEEIYLRLKTDELEKMLQGKDISALKSKIAQIYKNEYIPLSKKVLGSALASQNHRGIFQELYGAIDRAEQSHELPAIIKNQREKLIQLYPVVLTTVDSVQSNFYKYIKNRQTVDTVIIDEASQCDILSALPLLFLAKRIIVVGDSKQLEAIKGLERSEVLSTVDQKWDFVEHSFLTSIKQTMNPPSNMLLEHYRCDFNIINYCNKFFYDNQLIAYRGTSGHAMCLIDDDKGKYVEQNQGSFYNEREIVTIDEAVKSDVSHRFIITPFKEQSRRLTERYKGNQCGTIHTFQGKGEQEVYFSTVLNDTEEARRHLQSDHNLFSKELMNVAVSRAKERFLLVTDVTFFKKHDENVADLIRYIEVYGEQIPDKTVCLFDYLYRSMHTYKPNSRADNPFEEKLEKVIQKYVEEKEYLSYSMKLPLAVVVVDQQYLKENQDIKQFIEHHAHLDYTIYDKRINRPVLVIELDGKNHKRPEQIVRDRKKDAALKHMEIPILRIQSKDAWIEEKLWEALDEYCGISSK